jgi:hypothetical protein
MPFPSPALQLFVALYKRPVKEEEGLLLGFLLYGLLLCFLLLVWGRNIYFGFFGVGSFGRENNCEGKNY